MGNMKMSWTDQKVVIQVLYGKEAFTPSVSRRAMRWGKIKCKRTQKKIMFVMVIIDNIQLL